MSERDVHGLTDPVDFPAALERVGDDVFLRVNVSVDPCGKAALVAYTTALRWTAPGEAKRLRREAGLPFP